MKIRNIISREILDSRGNPTIETKVILQNGIEGKAAVPSGASTGSREALELRDGGKRYQGKGVLKAVQNVNKKIAKVIVGMEVEKLQEIDVKMIKLDGTKNKSRLGANAILSVSLACARAGTNNAKIPLYRYLRKIFGIKEKRFILPYPVMNIVNGGAHADSGLSVQEFMIIPQTKQMKEKIRVGAEVFHTLKSILKAKSYTTSVGDEGGFAPRLKNNEEAIKIILEAVKKSGYRPGKDICLGIDAAASEFFNKGKYNFEKEKTLSADQLIKVYENWLKKYPLILIEDGLGEQDWPGWKVLTAKLDDKAALVGDDIFVTNPQIFSEGIKQGIANTILIKVNQIGTLSETFKTIVMAKEAGYKTFVSHRSGETADTFIADLAVAVNADFIKTGSLSRSERVEKYNRLMEIEGELKNF